jgi:Zn-dependent M16 (insulinase) family peptidase
LIKVRTQYLSNPGLCYFSVYKSSSAVLAFEAAAQIIQAIEFTETFLDTAKSSVIFATINQQDTASQSAQVTFVNTIFKQRPIDYNSKMISRIQRVSMQDLKRVLHHVKRIFDPKTSFCTVVTTPNKLNEQREKFEAFGYSVRVYESVDKVQVE